MKKKKPPIPSQERRAEIARASSLSQMLARGINPSMQPVPLRVVVHRDVNCFVATSLEQEIVTEHRSVFGAVHELGRMFDARDAIAHIEPNLAPLAPASVDLVEAWNAGVDLGETELGAKRRANVRLLLR